MTIETLQKEVTALTQALSQEKQRQDDVAKQLAKLTSLTGAHEATLEKENEDVTQALERIKQLEQEVSRLNEKATQKQGKSGLSQEHETALSQVKSIVERYYSNDAELKAIADNLKAANE